MIPNNKIKYQFYCNNCSYKKIIDSNDIDSISEFRVLKTTPIQTKIPYLNENNTVQKEEFKNLSKKKYKCPKCGYILIYKKIEDLQQKINEKIELEKRLENQKILDEIEKYIRRKKLENNEDNLT